MKHDKCLMTQWADVFDHMRALDELMKSIQLVIKAATATLNDIIEKREFPPLNDLMQS